MAVFDAYSTNTSGGTAPPNHPAAPGTEEIYNALLNIAGQYRSQFEGSRDTLMSGVLPSAMRTWGPRRVLSALQNPYYTMKARYAALSALTGKPYYDRTGDGSRMKLFYVPGYQPKDAASELDYEANKSNYWTT